MRFSHSTSGGLSADVSAVRAGRLTSSRLANSDRIHPRPLDVAVSGSLVYGNRFNAAKAVWTDGLEFITVVIKDQNAQVHHCYRGCLVLQDPVPKTSAHRSNRVTFMLNSSILMLPCLFYIIT